MSTSRRVSMHSLAATTLVALLAACSSGGTPTSDPSAASPIPNVEATEAPATPDVESSTPDGEPSTPQVENLPDVTVDADGQRAFAPIPWEDQVAEWWRGYGIDGEPPPVDIIRVVPEEEYLDVQVQCLTEAGFPPREANDATGISHEVPDGQWEAFALADVTCRGQYPTDPAHLQPYNEEQINSVYDWILDETIPCYTEEGYVVNDVPSREAFADQWFTSRTHWIPEDGVAGQLPSTIDDVCPRIPPADQLYE